MMSKKWYLMAFISFALCWGLDYLIKHWFMLHPELIELGWLQFRYVENHGIMMGSFSKLPVILKTVFLSTVGVALIASLPLIMSLYKFLSLNTVVGLSLLLSGILGNVTDRLLYGYVIDYVYFKTSVFTSPVLNFADLVQWVGYALFAKGIFQEFSQHNHDVEKRNFKWINKSFQFRFCFLLLAAYNLLGLTFIAFGFTFIKYSLIELNINQEDLQHYLKFYCLTAAVLLGFSSLIVLLIAKILSQRIAGPAYAVTRYVNDTLLGKKYPLKFRKNDYLNELEEPLTKLNEKVLSEDIKKGA